MPYIILVASCPVNLTSLSEKIRAGQSASTVLNSELPVFKATPGKEMKHKDITIAHW